jgi:hypothetical protein
MPIEMRWLNEEKTVLLETFDNDWTVADYRQMVDEAAKLLATVSHTVHIIVDATATGSRLPNNLLSGGMSYAVRHVPTNQGLTVFVNASILVQMMINIARKISPNLANTIFLTDSVAKAQHIIEQQISKTD